MNILYEDLKKMFPLGMEIGIKQPLLILGYDGNFVLRNDNPSNIVLYTEDIDRELSNYDKSLMLKSRGDHFFKRGEYLTALKCFKSALEVIE